MKTNNIKNFSSKYFIDTVNIKSENEKNVTLKFFSFTNEYMLCGIKIVKKLIEETLTKEQLKRISIFSYKEGTILKKHQPALVINGDYSLFGFLENIIDGILARMSSIATNAWQVKKITNKDIIYMADRTDLYINQEYDGYAAYTGGIRKFVTNEMCKLIDQKDYEYVGTIPHSLIQRFSGNLIDALNSYYEKFKNDKLVALIDYNNDCLSEIEKLSKSNLKNKIAAVRIDTSSSLIDKSLQNKKKKLYGVNHELIKLVREKLDQCNMKKAKIIVSSGINTDKIKEFNKKKTPIDIYGIGNFFLNKSVLFTGDLIKLNDVYESKVGRKKSIEKYLDEMIKW